MKTLVVLAIVLSFFAGVSYNLLSVRAQSIGASPSTATPLSGCPAPAANLMNFCQVTNDPLNPTGVYLTSNGAPYFLLQPVAGGAGVQSFNTRTGKVVSAPNDYKWSDIASKPTTLSCTASSQSNTGLTASGCTLQ